MTPIQIIALLNGLATTVNAIAPVVQAVRAGMSSDDAAQVESAVADLGAALDVLHASTQTKLRG